MSEGGNGKPDAQENSLSNYFTPAPANPVSTNQEYLGLNSAQSIPSSSIPNALQPTGMASPTVLIKYSLTKKGDHFSKEDFLINMMTHPSKQFFFVNLNLNLTRV